MSTTKAHGTPQHTHDIHECQACEAEYTAGRAEGRRIAAKRKLQGAPHEIVIYYALSLPATIRRVGIMAGIADVYRGVANE